MRAVAFVLAFAGCAPRAMPATVSLALPLPTVTTAEVALRVPKLSADEGDFSSERGWVHLSRSGSSSAKTAKSSRVIGTTRVRRATQRSTAARAVASRAHGARTKAQRHRPRFPRRVRERQHRLRAPRREALLPVDRRLVAHWWRRSRRRITARDPRSMGHGREARPTAGRGCSCGTN